MLREFGSEFGFEVECIDPVVCRGEVVSSSAIRRAVAEGRVIDARGFWGGLTRWLGKFRVGLGWGGGLLCLRLIFGLRRN